MSQHYILSTPTEFLAAFNRQHSAQDQGTYDKLIIHIFVFREDGQLLMAKGNLSDHAWTVPMVLASTTSNQSKYSIRYLVLEKLAAWGLPVDTFRTLQFPELGKKAAMAAKLPNIKHLCLPVVLSVQDKHPEQTHLQVGKTNYPIRWLAQDEISTLLTPAAQNPTVAGLLNQSTIEAAFRRFASTKKAALKADGLKEIPNVFENYLGSLLLARGWHSYGRSLGAGYIGKPVYDYDLKQVLPIKDAPLVEVMNQRPGKILVKGEPHRVIGRWQLDRVMEMEEVYDWTEFMDDEGRLRIWE